VRATGSEHPAGRRCDYCDCGRYSVRANRMRGAEDPGLPRHEGTDRRREPIPLIRWDEPALSNRAFHRWRGLRGGTI